MPRGTIETAHSYVKVVAEPPALVADPLKEIVFVTIDRKRRKIVKRERSCPDVESVPGRCASAWTAKRTRIPVQGVVDNAAAGCSAEQSQQRFATSRLTSYGGFCVLPVMDDAARDFVTYIELANLWAAITEPLPESLYDLDALKRLRPIVYAVIHAFTWSLDDSLGLIGS